MVTRFEWLQFFITRPALYPELWRRTGSLMKGRSAEDERKENSRSEATEWCAARSIDTEEALFRLTGTRERESVERRHADVIGAARIEEKQCPVPMGGAGNLDLLFGLAEHLQAEQVVETGVAYGWSSLALLLSLQHRAGARLASIDMPYPERNNDRYVGCVVPKNLRAQWTLIRRADRQGLPMAFKMLDRIDLCHYDSDKSYAGRMWAYPLVWERLRPGGLFVSDDANDNLGFADFCSSLGIEPVIIETPSNHRGRKFVGVLAKPYGDSRRDT
jgi:predicted O-methyltransferase YrrM